MKEGNDRLVAAKTPDLTRFENERLWNWVRWARGGSTDFADRQCFSAESRYVAPKADEERLQRAARAPVDELDAQLVERAISTIPCARARFCIVWWYIKRKDEYFLGRKLKMHHRLVEGFRWASIRLVCDRALQLQHAEVQLIARGQPLWAGSCKLAVASV